MKHHLESWWKGVAACQYRSTQISCTVGEVMFSFWTNGSMASLPHGHLGLGGHPPPLRWSSDSATLSYSGQCLAGLWVRCCQAYMLQIAPFTLRRSRDVSGASHGVWPKRSCEGMGQESAHWQSIPLSLKLGSCSQVWLNGPDSLQWHSGELQPQRAGCGFLIFLSPVPVKLQHQRLHSDFHRYHQVSSLQRIRYRGACTPSHSWHSPSSTSNPSQREQWADGVGGSSATSLSFMPAEIPFLQRKFACDNLQMVYLHFMLYKAALWTQRTGEPDLCE